jgi:hypothetical protein
MRGAGPNERSHVVFTVGEPGNVNPVGHNLVTSGQTSAAARLGDGVDYVSGAMRSTNPICHAVVAAVIKAR